MDKDNPGYLRGAHYTDYVPLIKALEEQNNLGQLEKMLLELLDVVENENTVLHGGAPPYFYERLAILYRKQKRIQDEIAILQRFANQSHGPGVKPKELLKRLEKIQK